jgi:hypothetical protein
MIAATTIPTELLLIKRLVVNNNPIVPLQSSRHFLRRRYFFNNSSLFRIRYSNFTGTISLYSSLSTEAITTLTTTTTPTTPPTTPTTTTPTTPTHINVADKTTTTTTTKVAHPIIDDTIPLPVDILVKKEDAINKNHIAPKAIFPWRSESTMLQRLQGNTDEFLRIRRETLCCWSLLDLPWYHVLYDGGRSFRQNLADSVGYIFPHVVQSIITNVYTDNINVTSNNDTVRVDFTYSNATSTDGTDKKDNTAESSGTSTSKVETKEENSTKSNAGGTNNDWNDTEPLPSRSMFHPDLQNLYQSAYESMKKSVYDNIKIRLQTEPISASLYSIACVPGMTRQMVQTNPQLKKQYNQIMTMLSTRSISDGSAADKALELYMLAQSSDKLSIDPNTGALSTTIEIQVLINCIEHFHVQCGLTGTTIQGSDTIQNDVLHLVKLETTSIKYSFGNTTFHDWQIIDIDDLLLVSSTK